MTLSPSIDNSAAAKQAFAEFCLKIADVAITVSSADIDMKIQLDAEMNRFSGLTDRPDLSLRASWRQLTDECMGEEVFESGGTWRLYATDDSYFFQCFASNLGAAPYQVARLNRGFTSGEVYLHRPFFDTSKPINPLQYPLDELLMLNLLSRGRGVEIHACGLVDAAGYGYVFAGPSGAGKTTMARLWEREPGVTILSDDRIILRQVQGRVWMYGTPWHGEADLAQPACAPLRQLFFLRHSSENALARKAGADAAARLFSCTFPTFYDRAGLDFTLRFHERLAETVPCYEFGVVPNWRAVELIRKLRGQAP